MLEALSEIYHSIGEDEDIRCSIITGNDTAYKGKHYFSAGADVKAWSGRDKGTVKRAHAVRPMIFPVSPNRCLDCYNSDKPSIAMVNGTAIGAGADHAIATDITIASDDARIGWLYILRGLIPDDGGCWLLTKRIGINRAMELLLTGKIIDAEEAYRLGIFNKVVPHDQLRDATMEYANWFAKGPPLAIGATRRLAWQSLSQTYHEHMEAVTFAAPNVGADRREGMAAWAEKREPHYEGKGVTTG